VAQAREGRFWDVIEGRAPLPPVLSLLGWKVIGVEPGHAKAGFEGQEQFYNHTGLIHGGILASMLDGVMGAAAVSMLGPDENITTLEMKVSFMRPCRAGPLVGEGRVTHKGRSVIFTEGSLTAEDGSLLATATATARLVTSVAGSPEG
jgi:uncharacterized protein (TIGR00369 family)